MNVKTTFLNGELKEIIYIEQPEFLLKIIKKIKSIE